MQSMVVGVDPEARKSRVPRCHAHLRAIHGYLPTAQAPGASVLLHPPVARARTWYPPCKSPARVAAPQPWPHINPCPSSPCPQFPRFPRAASVDASCNALVAVLVGSKKGTCGFEVPPAAIRLVFGLARYLAHAAGWYNGFASLSPTFAEYLAYPGFFFDPLPQKSNSQISHPNLCLSLFSFSLSPSPFHAKLIQYTLFQFLPSTPILSLIFHHATSCLATAASSILPPPPSCLLLCRSRLWLSESFASRSLAKEPALPPIPFPCLPSTVRRPRLAFLSTSIRRHILLLIRFPLALA